MCRFPVSDTLADLNENLEMWENIFGLLRRQAGGIEKDMLYEDVRLVRVDCMVPQQWDCGGEAPLACPTLHAS